MVLLILLDIITLVIYATLVQYLVTKKVNEFEWKFTHVMSSVENKIDVILMNVKKGNKDSQEVKTKLTNLRQLVERTHKEPVHGSKHLK